MKGDQGNYGCRVFENLYMTAIVHKNTMHSSMKIERFVTSLEPLYFNYILIA